MSGRDPGAAAGPPSPERVRAVPVRRGSTDAETQPAPHLRCPKLPCLPVRGRPEGEADAGSAPRGVSEQHAPAGDEPALGEEGGPARGGGQRRGGSGLCPEGLQSGWFV